MSYFCIPNVPPNFLDHHSVKNQPPMPIGLKRSPSSFVCVLGSRQLDRNFQMEKNRRRAERPLRMEMRLSFGSDSLICRHRALGLHREDLWLRRGTE